MLNSCSNALSHIRAETKVTHFTKHKQYFPATICSQSLQREDLNGPAPTWLTPLRKEKPRKPCVASSGQTARWALRQGGWAKKIKKRNNFKIQKNLQGVKHNFYHFCRFFHFFVKGC